MTWGEWDDGHVGMLGVRACTDGAQTSPQASAVDEAVKLPMLRDAMRIVSVLNGFSSTEVDDGPPAHPTATSSTAADDPSGRSGGGGGVFGTRFHEVVSDGTETRHLQLLARLRDIFELHSPSSSVFEATCASPPPSPTAPSHSLPPPPLSCCFLASISRVPCWHSWGDSAREDAQATSSAGPKWKAPTFARFLTSAGLVGGHRASALAAGLSRPDADLIYASVCGKGVRQRGSRMT